ncbi:hypothetical protein D3C74_454430 [compost metagenome]
MANTQRLAGDLPVKSRSNNHFAGIALVKHHQHFHYFHIVSLVFHVRLAGAAAIADGLIVHPLPVQRFAEVLDPLRIKHHLGGPGNILVM